MKINITKQSGIYTLTSEQILPISLEKAWDFFSKPINLDKITPAEMDFKITNNPPDTTYLGQIITYKIGVLPMIKSNWVTEITHFESPLKNENRKGFFVDEQRFGPYAMWHHEHHFAPVEKGVLMTDRVTFKIPFGIFGRLAYFIFIRRKLYQIFSFRTQTLNDFFK